MGALSETAGPGDVGNYYDTLRLNETDRLALLASLPAAPRSGGKAGAATAAGPMPPPAPHLARLCVDMSHSGGFSGRFVVHAVGLSQGAITFLHGSYVHAGTSCVFRFAFPGGGNTAVCGTVAGCALIRGKIHQVEAIFVKPIDLEALSASKGTPPAPIPIPAPGAAEPGADRAAALAMAGEITKLVDALDSLDSIKAKARALAKSVMRSVKSDAA